MNSEKKEFVMSAENTLQSELATQSVLVESSGEFVLPDYVPKVQKVLRVEAQATPPSKYIGAKDVQMSGNVLHTLIYLGEEGEVGAAVLPSKYEFSLPLENSSAVKTVVTALDVESLNFRLGGPRKINIRTRLRAKECITACEDIGAELLGDGESVHKLYGEIDTQSTVLLSNAEITVSDIISTATGENSRLLWCGSNAAISDVKVVDRGVRVHGEVVCKVLFDDDGMPKFFTKKSAFEEFLEGDVRRGAEACCSAKVVSTEASKQSSGETAFDSVIYLEALVDTPCKVSVLKDAFSVMGEGSVERRVLNVQKSARSQNGIYNVSAGVQCAPPSSVLDTSGNAILDEIAVNNGKLTAIGRCMLNSIFLTAENTVSSSEFTVPFKIVIGGEYSGEVCTFANALLVNIRANPTASGIDFDMDIAVFARVQKSESVSAVKKCDFENVKAPNEDKYPLCVVYSKGESLWSLAKKYRVCPSKLAKINSLEIDESDMQNEEKLAVRRALMIEMK